MEMEKVLQNLCHNCFLLSLLSFSFYRMTLGYVPGWVDDGDDKRGNLAINGEKPARTKGNIYPSPILIAPAREYRYLLTA